MSIPKGKKIKFFKVEKKRVSVVGFCVFDTRFIRRDNKAKNRFSTGFEFVVVILFYSVRTFAVIP